MLRPLRYRDFRTLWTGTTISLIGDGIMLVALTWKVLTLSNTPAGLAIVGISISIPQVTLALYGGIVSDRFERTHVMIASDAVRGLAVLSVAALSFAGALQLWHLVVAGMVFGAGSAFFIPAFEALVPDLVPPDLLTQANSLDQLARPLTARLAGPMLGGFLIGTLGVAGAFAIDALTFAVSMLCLWRMNPLPSGVGDARSSSIAELRECFHFVRAHAWLWATLVSLSVAGLLFLGPSEVLLPFVVRHELHASAGTLGAVIAFGGLGAAAAAIFVGHRGLPRRCVTFMYVVWSVSTLGIAAYGLAHFAWQLMAACFAFNALETAGLIAWASMRQRLVPRHLLGKVASLDWMVATGLLPVSLALVGPAAAALGPRTTLIGAGLLASFVTALAGLLVRDVRPADRAPASFDDTRSPLSV